MKYIDLFEAYSEGSKPRIRKIPQNWVKLNSIGYVLDPKTGFAYPYSNDGQSYYLDELFDSQADGGFNGLNEEDQKIVDQYYKSVEPLVKDHINFDLIDTIKDASLDYVDNGMWLMIHVDAYTKPPGFYSYQTNNTLQVYYESFFKDKTYKQWSKYYKHDMELIDIDKLKYSLTIVQGESKDQYPYKRVHKAEAEVLEFVKKMALENGWNDTIVRK